MAGTSPAMTVGERTVTARAPRFTLRDKGPVGGVCNRLLQLGLGVHHDRPVPGDRLADRLAGDKQEPDALVAGLDGNVVAAVEDDQRPVTGLLADDDLGAVHG